MDKSLLFLALIGCLPLVLVIWYPTMPHIQNYQALPNYNKYGPNLQRIALVIFGTMMASIIALLIADHRDKLPHA